MLIETLTLAQDGQKKVSIWFSAIPITISLFKCLGLENVGTFVKLYIYVYIYMCTNTKLPKELNK